MTVTRTDMLNAFPNVNYTFIDILNSWISNEAINLQGFINNPTEHAEYNPYIIPDYSALQQRVNMLNQASQALTVISEYKQGMTVSDSQYESAIDSLPVDLFERLEAWMVIRKQEMDGLLSNPNINQALSPISAYADLFTFDSTKYDNEYQMFIDGLSGIETLVEYKIENPPVASTTTTATTTTTTTSTTSGNTSGNTSGGTTSGNVLAVSGGQTMA